MLACDALKNRLMEGDIQQMHEIKQQVFLLVEQEEEEAKAHFEAITALNAFIRKGNITFDGITSDFISTPHVNMLATNDTMHGFIVEKQQFETLEEFQKLELDMHQDLIKMCKEAEAMNQNRLCLIEQMLQKLEGQDLSEIPGLVSIKAQIKKMK